MISDHEFAVLAHDALHPDHSWVHCHQGADVLIVRTIPRLQRSLAAGGYEVALANQPRPVTVINITGGCEQWTITAAGVGDPEVFILDFDDEADLEWAESNLARYREATDLVAGRIDDTTLATMREGIENEAQRVEAIRAIFNEDAA